MCYSVLALGLLLACKGRGMSVEAQKLRGSNKTNGENVGGNYRRLQRQQIYDLAADFSATNPNGIWTYGKYNTAQDPTSFATFTDYSEHAFLASGQPNANIKSWSPPGQVDPNIAKNVGTSVASWTAAALTFNPGKVVFGPYLGPTVARFTAPVGGTYQVDASFAGTQTIHSPANAYIYDGSDYTDLGSTGTTVQYSNILQLVEGAYVDFVVGDQLKSTQVSATIKPIYDLAADFSATNPNGIWTYGKYNTAQASTSFATFTDYSEHAYLAQGQPNSNIKSWSQPGQADPSITKNVGTSVSFWPAATVTFNPGKVLFGPYLGPTVARFTAPAGGTYQVDASFVGTQTVHSPANAYIYDGSDYTDLGSTGTTVQYSNILQLVEGAYVDFVVGDQLKTTQVSATIKPVSLPHFGGDPVQGGDPALSQEEWTAEENSLDSLDENPLYTGHLFGAGFQQYAELEIQKDIQEVNTICYSKCMEDEECSGFGYNVNNRYDGRANGNCWFMKGEIKHVDDPQSDVNTGGVWIKGAVYEEIPDISEADTQKVLDWIKYEVYKEKLPFCWKDSNNRGVGTIPGRVADCPKGYTNNGANCGRGDDWISAPSKVADCPSGYTNHALFGCHRVYSTHAKNDCCFLGACCCGGCNSGYYDAGCFCARDAKSVGHSQSECPEGYFLNEDLGTCHVECAKHGDGYYNNGEYCYRPPSTKGISSMICKSNEEKIGARCFPKGGSCFNNEEEENGLCYTKCDPGYSGEAFLCWTDCGHADMVDCGAACATSDKECGLAVANQALSVLIVAANVATLGISSGTGASSAANAGVKSVTIGGKVLNASKTVGKALINVLQRVKPVIGAKQATVIRKVFNPKTAKWIISNPKYVKLGVRAVGKTPFVTARAAEQYRRAYANDFAGQTSAEINGAIDAHFDRKTASSFKMAWADVVAIEMAEAEGWATAKTVLLAASIEPTGIAGVAEAFANPECQKHVPFPCTEANLQGC